MDALIYSATFTVVAFVVFLAAKPLDKRLGIAFGVLFALYLGLDDLVTGLPSQSSAFAIVGGSWNWSGKIYSLALAVLVILALRLSRDATGLRLAQRNLRASLIAMPFLIAVGVALGMVFKPEPPTVETMAFQALMPALAEEIAYRGIAPAILLGLIHGRAAPERTPWAVVLITAIMFGLWHGLKYDDGVFAFDWIPAAYTFTGGVAYGWLRFSSGSLLMPMLAHGGANLLFQLMGFAYADAAA